MAAAKRRSRKSTAPKVSRRMAAVKPLRSAPGIARKYDYGFKPPRERSPWQDEGRPEASG
ncbi:MAG TPA: hypothetical protein VFL90_15225 [Methylomirabilota bacterium]|jgi:hypothetical protein|nr:hypothetical protein [Methylomirabilota bacterium]